MYGRGCRALLQKTVSAFCFKRQFPRPCLKNSGRQEIAPALPNFYFVKMDLSEFEHLTWRVEFKTGGGGGLEVEVFLSQPFVHRGETISGTVLLKAGGTPRPVLKLTLELQAFQEVHSKNSSYLSFKTQEAVTLDQEMEGLVAGESREYPFHFLIPEQGFITEVNTGTDKGWAVLAQAHLRWAVDARHRAHVIVIPERPYWALEQLLRQHYGFGVIGRVAQGGAIHLNMRSPERWKSLIDAILFKCKSEAGAIRIEAIVNWQEVSLVDYLKAMVGADRTKHEWVLSISDLLDEENQPSDRARSYLNTFFSQLNLPLV